MRLLSPEHAAALSDPLAWAGRIRSCAGRQRPKAAAAAQVLRLDVRCHRAVRRTDVVGPERHAPARVRQRVVRWGDLGSRSASSWPPSTWPLSPAPFRSTPSAFFSRSSRKHHLSEPADAAGLSAPTRPPDVGLPLVVRNASGPDAAAGLCLLRRPGRRFVGRHRASLSRIRALRGRMPALDAADAGGSNVCNVYCRFCTFYPRPPASPAATPSPGSSWPPRSPRPSPRAGSKSSCKAA